MNDSTKLKLSVFTPMICESSITTEEAASIIYNHHVNCRCGMPKDPTPAEIIRQAIAKIKKDERWKELVHSLYKAVHAEKKKGFKEWVKEHP